MFTNSTETQGEKVAQVLAARLVCPFSRSALRAEDGALVSESGERYALTPHGYFDFTRDAGLAAAETTSEEYAEDQQGSWRRFFDDYLYPFIAREPHRRVLEVGTGLGMGITFLVESGIEAYGIDLPSLSRYWARIQNDPRHFLHCDGAAMPFPDGYFDVVYTLGVIEHIGSVVGHYTLREDFQARRRNFADEILRVTRPGGRILVSCPNKAFPIDLAHEPTDAATPPGKLRFRRWFYDRTGMTVHPVWGTYHLLSYGEVESLFCGNNRAESMRPLPLRGYFTFTRFGSGPFGFLKPLVAACVNNIPPVLLKSPLNPFVIAEIRR